MRIIKTLVALAVVVGFVLGAGMANAYALDFPSPQGPVSDFANILSPSEKEQLNQTLTTYQQQTGNSIVVVTIQSLEGEDLNDYTNKLFEKWGVGAKGNDNGIMILAAIAEREIRIEVGYGLEGNINDAKAGDIIRSDIIPNFAQSKYYDGFNQAISTLIFQTASPTDTIPQAEESSDSPIGGIIVFLFFFFPYLGAFLGRSKSIWAGGALGGIAGLAIGLIAKSIIVAGFAGIFLGIFGLILDVIFSKNYENFKKSGKTGGFWGGGFSGGSGSSGGFGGFGGGHSGGGGASGRW